jgi:23S rRNA (guanosine2251-2'-O)-methyltransferase
MREWIYGRNPVYETLRAGRRRVYRLRVAKGVSEKGRLRDIIRICEESSHIVESIPRERMDKEKPRNQGVMLEVGAYPYSSLVEILEQSSEQNRPPLILILDTLQDPQNLGTLLRTAEAVGVHGVVLPLRRASGVTPAVVNASSGASEHLQITRDNLAQTIKVLKANDIWVYGLDGSPEAKMIDQVNIDGALGLVIGNEGYGMRRLVRDSCDVLVRFPMRGRVESLNAAVAGSVALYMAWQARGFDTG